MTIKKKLNIGIIILLSIFGLLGLEIYFMLSKQMPGTAEIVVSVLALTGVLNVYVFGASINRSITEPITKLKNAMVQIGEGRFDVKIEISSDDEIGQLASCLDNTVQKLQTTTTSIEKLNIEISKRKEVQLALQKAHDDLELRVEQRTVELAAANRELEKLNLDKDMAVKDLSRSNQDLQEFSYVVAHDLKAPLRGITTLADWIMADYADKLDENGRKQLEMLESKAKQTTDMINDILEYSKVGRTLQELKEVDLNILLSEIVSGLLDQAACSDRKNTEITVDENLPVVICDHTQILQVFQNLLTNAIKYMDKPDGKIHVSCSQSHGSDQSEASGSDEWLFSVSDNGPGIEKCYFDRIFKLFQTIPSRQCADSTGIGLSIVKKIVELNGGRIWLDSEISKGSTFHFTFPKHKKETVLLQDVVTAYSEFAGKTV